MEGGQGTLTMREERLLMRWEGQELSIVWLWHRQAAHSIAQCQCLLQIE
jgi:hypothetical protein